MFIGKICVSSFLISICSSFLTGIRVKKAEKQIFIKDLFIYGSVPFVAQGDLVECTLRCAIADGCMSIFYNKASRECRGTYSGYEEEHLLLEYNVTGWSYYLIYHERCPRVSGYIYSEQFEICYKFHPVNTSRNYKEYDPICNDEGGELMKIDSEEKQQYAEKFLGHFEFDSRHFIFFQGYHYTREEHWYYNNGSIMTYFNWHPSQPNSGTFHDYEIVGMKKTDNYTWNDLYDHNYGAFLCERPILEIC